MVEAVRRREERRIWISRGQLSALALTTLFIAVLAFFVGLRFGQGQAGAPAPAVAPALLPDPQQEDALEELLRQVEVAQADAGSGLSLSFPGALSRDDVPAPPTVPITAVSLGSSVAPPPHLAPPTPEELPPLPAQEGWSVQVGSYEDPNDAELMLQQLAGAGWPAYRVTTLVKGQNWHRVRIGGYKNQEEASTAGAELAAALGVAELTITRAP